MPEITLRNAQKNDAPLILDFIKALADYEKLSHSVSATLEQLEKTLFEQNAARIILAEVDGEPAGFALYFYNYSTFLAKKGLYLEDLYVDPKHRNCGIGKTLFNALKEQAIAEGCGRMEWSVLDWNQDAWAFYEGQGAKAMDDWTVHRIEF